MSLPSEAQQLAALEEAILARASELAAQIQAKAARQRDEILRTTNERIRRMEERETHAAKANAERLYRRRVQASELQLQGRLEELRWQLVLEQEQQLRGRFLAFRSERSAYRTWLGQLLEQGLGLMPDTGLLVELNEDDLHWLRPLWPELQSSIRGGGRLMLAERPCGGSGGLLLSDESGHTRLDNRFEGLVLRRREALLRTLQLHLFQAQP